MPSSVAPSTSSSSTSRKDRERSVVAACSALAIVPRTCSANVMIEPPSNVDRPLDGQVVAQRRFLRVGIPHGASGDLGENFGLGTSAGRRIDDDEVDDEVLGAARVMVHVGADLFVRGVQRVEWRVEMTSATFRRFSWLRL